jgi:hypothetical protein
MAGFAEVAAVPSAGLAIVDADPLDLGGDFVVMDDCDCGVSSKAEEDDVFTEARGFLSWLTDSGDSSLRD